MNNTGLDTARNYIIIHKAKVHNLKNLTLKIPKNKLIVFTGVSGSGKSSLAFDTIYAEGQRKYVESLSSYARQFLGLMEKPDVEKIEGLSPSIAINQSSTLSNPRSTVGTITEIYDYLRLLFGRLGKPFCYKCGRPIESQTIQEIVDKILKIPSEKLKDTRIMLLSPIVKNKKGEFKNLIQEMQSKGFARARIDGKIINFDTLIELQKNKKHTIEIIIDRILISKEINLLPKDEFLELRRRITDSVETCLRLGKGEIIINLYDENKDIFFSEKLYCKHCNISYPNIDPNLFSFNSPLGACRKCHGLGEIKEIDPNSIYNPNLTILEGGIFPLSDDLDKNSNKLIIKLLKAWAEKRKINLNIQIKNYSKDILNEILYGSKTELEIELKNEKFTGKYKGYFEGIIPYLHRKYQETNSESTKKNIEKYMYTKICDDCQGYRLKKEALNVHVCGKNIIELSKMQIKKLYYWIDEIINDKFTKDNKDYFLKNDLVFKKHIIQNEIYEEQISLSLNQKTVAIPILKEIKSRLNFLLDVGLNYLSLDRSSRTLSGGEAQRIRLASQIGSGLSGVIYVLDEPSIGLHQKDNDMLIKTLKKLKNLGNTLIVVEHDEDTIKSSDWVIELGPGAGIKGGNLIYSGDIKNFQKARNSITAQYVFKQKIVGDKYLNKNKKNINNRYLTIHNARANNLKNITVSFPLGNLICVTGVSGSGKSTLVNDILYNYLHNYFYKTRKIVGEHDHIEGIEYITNVINVDQSPIGKTPRSNPATYIKVFDEIRKLFANTNESKARGYNPTRFSFNVKGGRCENCKGDGVMKVEMLFLPDIYVTCEVCQGKKYNRETLEIEYKGKNIYEVLDMTVDEAIIFFKNINKIYEPLKLLQDVGLGYIKLGQPANTLSGGEAQRIKLASELKKRNTGNTLYILDEPTTGLHFLDIERLLDILHKLVSLGNTVIVIEHNLDVIKTADWIIDLGPEGGDKGGQIVFVGSVNDIIKCGKSYTGKYLKKIINN